jgi:hypothetical protein
MGSTPVICSNGCEGQLDPDWTKSEFCLGQAFSIKAAAYPRHFRQIWCHFRDTKCNVTSGFCFVIT